MANEKISIAMTGDLILDEPGTIEEFFAPVMPVLNAQDIMAGHIETPHTTFERAEPSCIDIQAPPSNPEHLNPLKGVFDVVSCASNHSYDCGPNGILDTISKLDELGIPHCGTGKNIYEAKKPVYLDCKGIKVGFISYNLTGPKLGWAMSQKPGTNHVKVETAYIPNFDMPGGSCRTKTWIEPADEEQFKNEVKELKANCDVAVILAHIGIGGDIPKLCDYEPQFTHGCIDAGADIVFCHHHHILKGVEVYKGKPIYHGLGNFVCATYAMTAGKNDTPEMIAYLKVREKEGRGGGHYKVDFYPWSELSRLTGLAQVYIDKEGNCENYFIPCYIEDDGSVTPRSRDNGGQAVFDFLKKQTDGAFLGAELSWTEDGNKIVVK